MQDRLYLHNWDRLRIFAAIDTAALHLTSQHALMGIGLPLFLVLSVALSTAKMRPPPTRRFIDRRLARIFYPWLFWCVVIALIRVRNASLAGEALWSSWWKWSMVLYGPSIHLWFLPFIVVAGIAAHFIHRRTATYNPLVVSTVAVVVGAAAAAIPGHANVWLAWKWPFEQWAFSLPALPLGLALGRLLAFESRLSRLRWWFTSAFGLFAALAVWLAWVDPQTEACLLRFGGALAALVGAVWLPNVKDAVTRFVTPLLLGIYVMHYDVWDQWVRPRLEQWHMDQQDWVRVAATCLLALIMTALLRQTPLRKVL